MKRALLTVGLSLGCACGAVMPESGGGMIKAPASRPINAADIALSPGYAIEPIAAGMTFPTGVTFDDRGRVYVVESGYSYGEVFLPPKLLRVGADGTLTTIATGESNGPWTGVAFHDGVFYVAEGGEVSGGRILSVGMDGTIKPIADKLPTGGDHHTDGPTIGPDGKLYFGLGTMTNSAVVGDDNFEFGWPKRRPEGHDVPCRDVTLVGTNFESKDPSKGGDARATTGAFMPFGTASQAGQVVKGQVPCSGAVLRVGVSGGEPELVAWGFRNPFGLAFTGDGRLLVTDNGYDERGSRPVWGSADWLWIVNPSQPPLWHGWPEYADGNKLTEKRYKPNSGPQPGRLLTEDPNPPPVPRAFFACHSSSNGLDVSRSKAFGYEGQAFVAQFGDQSPTTGKTLAPTGFKVVRVDLSNGVIEEFAANKGKENGPASYQHGGGLERPVAVRFTPDGNQLYIVDFGVMTMSDDGPHPQQGTGVLWRIQRTGRS
jgi:glucose/arabinose dehydrogenase